MIPGDLTNNSKKNLAQKRKPMKQDRRTFIKVTSLASVTLVPVVGTLAQVLGKKEEEISTLLGGSFNKDFEFHVIDNNLLNLHFYFINVKKSGSSLVPVGGDQKIVLQAADEVKVTVSTNNAVDVIASLLEIS